MALSGRLLGDERTFSLEHRLANGLMLVVASTAIAAAVLNGLLDAVYAPGQGVSALTNYVLTATGAVYLGLYAWSRRTRAFLGPAWGSLLAFVLLFYPALWVSNYGIDGSMSIVGLAAMVAIASVFWGWRRNVMLGVALASTVTLLSAEYHGFVGTRAYATRASRYLDTFWTLVQVGAGMVALVIVMRTSYRQERDKANEYSRLVEETNRQLERLLATNQALARTDELTRLPNRRQFQALLTQRIGEATRYHRALSIGVLDLDHFKSINDTYGHATGDQVLAALGELLTKELRESDICARWGGEEFVLLCPETPLEGMNTVAERLRVAVQRHGFPSVPRVTVSIGIAAWRDGDTWQGLFARADEALYAAKSMGRNCVSAEGPAPNRIATSTSLG